MNSKYVIINQVTSIILDLEIITFCHGYVTYLFFGLPISRRQHGASNQIIAAINE